MRLRTKLAALAITGAVAVTATTAYAYWTSGGDGVGSASAGDVNADLVVVNQDSDASGLYPGRSIALSGDFDNGNASPVYIARVTASVHDFTTSSGNSKPECTDEDFEILGTSTVPGEIANGVNVGAWSGLSIRMIDKTTNQDNCKNLSASSLKIDYVAHAS